jgi:hypothetical protein
MSSHGTSKEACVVDRINDGHLAVSNVARCPFIARIHVTGTRWRNSAMLLELRMND